MGAADPAQVIFPTVGYTVGSRAYPDRDLFEACSRASSRKTAVIRIRVSSCRALGAVHLSFCCPSGHPPPPPSLQPGLLRVAHPCSNQHFTPQQPSPSASPEGLQYRCALPTKPRLGGVAPARAPRVFFCCFCFCCLHLSKICASANSGRSPSPRRLADCFSLSFFSS